MNAVSRTPLWQKSLLGLVLWLPLEDQLRKVTGNPLWLFLLKDAIVLVAVLACHATTPGGLSLRMIPRGLRLVLAWGVVLHVLGAFNPLLSGLTVPVVGIKMTFSYVPLLLVGYVLAQDGRALRRVLLALVATGAAVAVVGLYQAFVDPSLLTPERTADTEGLQLWESRGSVAYITSLFISPGRYVLFLLNSFAAALTLSFLGSSHASRLAVLAAGGVIALGLLSSGGRTGPASIAGVLLLAFAIGRWQHARDSGRAHAGMTLRVLVAAGATALLLAVAAARLPQLGTILGFYRESLSEDGPAERFRGVIDQASDVVDSRTWLMGRGTGSASFGVTYLDPVADIQVEGGYLTHLWELGVLGLTFYLALAAALSRLFLARPPGGGTQSHQAVATGIGALVLWELWAVNFLAPVLQQYVVAIFLWLFAGVAHGLNDLPTRAHDQTAPSRT